jgi:hypothetical protein
LVVGFGFFGVGKMVEPWFLQWEDQSASTSEQEHSSSEHSHDEEHRNEEGVSP